MPAQITVLYDPGHQSAPLVLGVLQQITVELNAQLADAPPALALAPEAIDAREFRRIDYMLPGVLAMALMQLGLMVTAVQAVIQRERQILRRIGLAPVSRLTMITADVGFRLTIGVGELVIIAVLGWIVYGVPVRFEHTLPVLGLVLLGGAVFLVLGYVLAALARTEESIHAIIALPNALMMMLSGILFPIEDMPGWVQPIAGLLPITFLGDALRHQMIGLGSRYGLATDVAVLVGWLIVCTVLAVRWFKWEPQT